MKQQCFKEIDSKCLKYVETPQATGPGSFLVYCQLQTQWEMHPSGLHFYLGISQSVSATLLALLKRSSIPFGHFPMRCQYPLGTAQMISKSYQVHISQCVLAGIWHFHYNSLEAACFLFLKCKILDQTEKSLNQQPFLS